jgi:hypothetical protein
VGGFIRDLDAPSPLPHCNLTTPHRRLVADLKNSASWVRRTLREGDERRQTRSEGAEHASSAGSPESEQIRDAHSETHVAQRGYNDGSTDCLSPVHRMTNPTIAPSIEIWRCCATSGIPVDSDRRRGGGLRMEQGWSLGRVHLSESEAIGMLLSLTIAEKVGSPLMLDDARMIMRSPPIRQPSDVRLGHQTPNEDPTKR